MNDLRYQIVLIKKGYDNKMKRFKDKKVIVVGTGKSGIGSAALLEKMAPCRSYMMGMSRPTKRQ